MLGRKAALFIFSTVLCLYGAELALRILGPPVQWKEYAVKRIEARAKRAADLGIAYDRRMPLDVILDMRKEGTLVYPSGSFEAYLLNQRGLVDAVGPLNLEGKVRSRFVSAGKELLPLGNRSRTTMIGLENENGYYPVFTTDERGFRNPPGIWSLPEVDVVGVGDSYVEGCEVNDADAFMSHIRARFPRTINLGMGGGSPLTMLAALREYGTALKPKVVLWCFHEESDFNDLYIHMLNPTLAAYRNDPTFRQNLLERQGEIDETLLQFMEGEIERVSRYRQERSEKWGDRAIVFARSVRSFLALGRLRRRVSVVLDERRSVETFEAPEVVAAFWEILRDARQLAHTWGGKLYFVHLPDASDLVLPRGVYVRQLAQLRAQMKKDVRALGISYIDLPTHLRSRADAMELVPLGYDGHFSPKGNRAVAAVILDRLLRDPDSPLHQRAAPNAVTRQRGHSRPAVRTGRDGRLQGAGYIAQ
jgi:hypothetical protein